MKIIRISLAFISFFFFFASIWSITPDEAIKCVMSGIAFCLAIVVTHLME